MLKSVEIGVKLIGKLAKEVRRKVLTTFQNKRILYLESSSDTPPRYSPYAGSAKRYDLVTGIGALAMAISRTKTLSPLKEVDFQ
jgi:hypothetical protein